MDSRHHRLVTMTNGAPGAPMLWRLLRGGRARGVIALSAAAIAVLAACTGPSPTPSPTEPTTSPTLPEPVTLSWWYQEGGEALGALWQDVAADFEAAHPHVTVEVTEFQPYPVEGDRSQPPPRPDDLPDIVQLWRPTDVRTWSAAGRLRDLTDDLAPQLEAIGGPAAAYRIDDRSYAVPWAFSSFGFWYNKDVFADAGIERVPTTLDELYEAIGALKAAGFTPIAVDGGDDYAIALYWEHFAAISCPATTLAEARATLRFDDPCFVDAGAHLAELVAADPFDADAPYRFPGGPNGAEGLVATNRAGMTLSGSWAPGLMPALLLPSEEVPELGWFPFPAATADGETAPSLLGIGRAFAVSAEAPAEAVDLLRHILDTGAQSGQSDGWVPVVPGSEGAVGETLQPMLMAQREAAHVGLAHAVPSEVSIALDEAVGRLFRGNGTPQGIVDAMNAAGEAA